MQARVDALLGDLATPTFAGLAARASATAASQPRRVAGGSTIELDHSRPRYRRILAASHRRLSPLLFGVIVGNYFNFGITTDIQAAENWEDELAMISLTDYTENRVEL